MATGCGTALLGAAATAGGWRTTRLWFSAPAVVAVSASTTALVEAPRPGPVLTQVESQLVTWPLWLGTVFLLLVWAATRGRGPDRATAAAAVLAVPLVGVGVSAVTTLAATGDLFTAASVALAALVMLAFPAVIAPAALLVWLAAEGLRLSRDVGTWAPRGGGGGRGRFVPRSCSCCW